MPVHKRREHMRAGRPVRATVAHHQAGQGRGRTPPVLRDRPDTAVAFRRAGHALAVAGGLVVVYGATAVLSLTAAALCGVTTWALVEMGVMQRRRRRRRRPLALSRRRRRQLRVFKARRRFERQLWQPVREVTRQRVRPRERVSR